MLLARDEGNEFPLATNVLLQHVYMDDIVRDGDDLGTAKENIFFK